MLLILFASLMMVYVAVASVNRVKNDLAPLSGLWKPCHWLSSGVDVEKLLTVTKY